MDLSKAFDCLPHDFILAKLSVYGLSAIACDFLKQKAEGQSRAIL